MIDAIALIGFIACALSGIAIGLIVGGLIYRTGREHGRQEGIGVLLSLDRAVTVGDAQDEITRQMRDAA